MTSCLPLPFAEAIRSWIASLSWIVEKSNSQQLDPNSISSTGTLNNSSTTTVSSPQTTVSSESVKSRKMAETRELIMKFIRISDKKLEEVRQKMERCKDEIINLRDRKREKEAKLQLPIYIGYKRDYENRYEKSLNLTKQLAALEQATDNVEYLSLQRELLTAIKAVGNQGKKTIQEATKLNEEMQNTMDTISDINEALSKSLEGSEKIGEPELEDAWSSIFSDESNLDPLRDLRRDGQKTSKEEVIEVVLGGGGGREEEEQQQTQEYDDEEENSNDRAPLLEAHKRKKTLVGISTATTTTTTGTKLTSNNIESLDKELEEIERELEESTSNYQNKKRVLA
jgi:hypothetical protein